ncbi:nitrogen fixation protein NifH [Chloroflexota bacterium]
MDRSKNDKELKDAKTAIMSSGPVPAILTAQKQEGFWDKPGAGYGPKYRGTQWAIVFIAQLGADGTDPRVRAGCEYLLSHAISVNGSLSMNGTPSGFIHCMAGNLGSALIDLGWLGDQRLWEAMEWLALTITGEGIADSTNRETKKRYYKSGTSAPLFTCSVNADLPCAWGAIKAMLALSKVPSSLRTQGMQAAIQQGIAFLLSHNPAIADYPFGMGSRPNSSWFKFGFPLGYITDVLQNLEVLAYLDQAQNPKLAQALELVINKQDEQGRWMLDYSYNGKTWVDIEKKGQPSKWVTLRALRVLKAAFPEPR